MLQDKGLRSSGVWGGEGCLYIYIYICKVLGWVQLIVSGLLFQVIWNERLRL